ncbi:hypothetical protein SAE02_62440 [Skermanella aerolata]|uniref:Uncharacterized protein n=1 Tax=Skermanella aerolata TaxID=393310 RepID=A0A512E035_9PROT|nr:hypothetical protein [Skermanella aerolata]KJB91842.1 hypothetical protein N826_26155 [Skermanella aerolata KACC 11604]GEO42096.1 hypothetical protein SAE02_62440 [Skermanella aerolata]
MPNLALIANDHIERAKSVKRMNGPLYSGETINLDSGIRMPEDLEELVSQEPFIPDNLEVVGNLLERIIAE